MTDHDLRQYMRLAARAQAGTATLRERAQLIYLHYRLHERRQHWLKGLTP